MISEGLYLTQALFDTIMAHARRHANREVVGLLGGRGSRVMGVFPIENVSRMPAIHFEPDQQAFVASYFTIEEHGWELVAIYHSHPAGSRVWPSSTDIENANYPDALNLIISFDNDWLPIAHVFRIRDGHVEEVPLHVDSGDA